MINFLSNLYDFKKKARTLNIYLQTLISISELDVNYIFDILVDGENKNVESMILNISQRIYGGLQFVELDLIGLNKVQHILAFVSINKDYQHFKNRVFENRLDVRKFLNMPVPIGFAKSLGKKTMIHPFPKVFEQYQELNPWKNVWLSNNKSTAVSPFLPPAVPLQCFGKGKLNSKKYQSWPKNKKSKYYKTNKYLRNEEAGVIIYNQDLKVVGCMKWHWWSFNTNFSGSDFTILFSHGNKMVYIGFDIRPRYKLPTLGPDIISEEYIKTGSCKRVVQSALNEVKSIRFSKVNIGNQWLEEHELEELYS